MSKIYLQTDHRDKVHGMGKGKLVSKVQDFAKIKLGLLITDDFLSGFTVTQLYGAMRAAQIGRWHKIFSQWKNHSHFKQLH